MDCFANAGTLLPQTSQSMKNFILPILLLLWSTGCTCPDPCSDDPAPPDCLGCNSTLREPGLVNEPVQVGLLPDSVKPNTADLAIRYKETQVNENDPGRYTLTTYIHNDKGNNCAAQKDTRAIIQLPQYSVVESVSITDSTGVEQPWRQCGAYIEAELPWLCPRRQGAQVLVTVKRSPYPHPGCQPAFGVMVFSAMPDMDPSNNYWWWRRACPSGTTDFTPLPSTFSSPF